jgi:hypothetical protein
MKKTRRNCQNHTKNAKNDISGITDILPGFSPYRLSPITSFHHIGDNRYYRDILESVTSLTENKCLTGANGRTQLKRHEQNMVAVAKARDLPLSPSRCLPQRFPGLIVSPHFIGLQILYQSACCTRRISRTLGRKFCVRGLHDDKLLKPTTDLTVLAVDYWVRPTPSQSTLV